MAHMSAACLQALLDDIHGCHDGVIDDGGQRARAGSGQPLVARAVAAECLFCCLIHSKVQRVRRTAAGGSRCRDSVYACVCACVRVHMWCASICKHACVRAGVRACVRAHPAPQATAPTPRYNPATPSRRSTARSACSTEP